MLVALNRKLQSMNSVALRSCLWIALVCLVAMTTITLLQVGARYLFSSPFAWPEEVARILMVWMTFLVVPYAYREGLLVRLESLSSKIPETLRTRIDMLIHGILLILFLLLLRESVWIVEKGSRIRTSSIDISMGWVFSVLPVSILLLIAVALEHLSSALIGNENHSPSGEAS